MPCALPQLAVSALSATPLWILLVPHCGCLHLRAIHLSPGHLQREVGAIYPHSPSVCPLDPPPLSQGALPSPSTKTPESHSRIDQTRFDMQWRVIGHPLVGLAGAEG